MSEAVIQATNLRKVYRLYASPGKRFLDMFGLLRKAQGAYTEHAALDGISLEIRRGEKVAFIGRNGAGKSTLLKLLTGVIEPTSGHLAVRGKAHALLQIGTGFHPDFTGRENVYAYLAQLGVTGKEADQRYAEIVDFAELEEYIGQPVKTYSSGMAVRLMFATSTAITPDLLVLDEVLGVGDAYFANKSYSRIRELCDRDHTTVLLVSHDVYSSAKLCERIIWIDQGRVVMDGPGPDVVKAYEDSIRVQEENRLRAKKQQRLTAALASQTSEATTAIVVELQAAENRPQPSPVWFSRISLIADGQHIATLPLGADAFEAEGASHLQADGSSWGAVEQIDGRQVRSLMNHGSPFHKVAGVFLAPLSAADLLARHLMLECEYWSTAPCALHATGYVGTQAIDFGALPPVADRWLVHRAAGTTATGVALRALNTSGAQGTGRVAIADVAVVNALGHETSFITHGQPMAIRIDYRRVDPTLRERPQVIIAISKEGVQTVCRYVARDLTLGPPSPSEGRIWLREPRVRLGVGKYSVSVMIAAEGYLDRDQTVFYSINPEVYASLRGVLEFEVHGEGLAPTNTAFVGEGQWTIDGR